MNRQSLKISILKTHWPDFKILEGHCSMGDLLQRPVWPSGGWFIFCYTCKSFCSERFKDLLFRKADQIFKLVDSVGAVDKMGYLMIILECFFLNLWEPYVVTPHLNCLN